MLVADIQSGEPVLGPNVAERLGSLGVTRVALLRDLSSSAVVLEGWAFDPARTDEAIRGRVPGRQRQSPEDPRGTAGWRVHGTTEKGDATAPKFRKFRVLRMTDLVACSIGAFAGPAAADRLRVRPLVRLPTTVTAFVEDGRIEGECKWYV